MKSVLNPVRIVLIILELFFGWLVPDWKKAHEIIQDHREEKDKVNEKGT